VSYEAQLIRVHPIVEEKVTLRINGVDLVCFAAHCPNEIQEGASYSVELIAQVFNDYVVEEAEKNRAPSAARIGDGFSYVLTGKLTGNHLNAGAFSLEDDMLLSDFGYLEGRIICWTVDRLDADFL
jgi:hypothetical protein